MIAVAPHERDGSIDIGGRIATYIPARARVARRLQDKVMFDSDDPGWRVLDPWVAIGRADTARAARP